MFKTLDATILYVRNIKRSKKFYLDLLKFIVEDDQGNYVSLKVDVDDDTKIALNSIRKKDHYPGHQTIVLITDDIHRTYENLKGKRVNLLLNLTSKAWGETFIFTDPDGNKIEVLER